jgi:hypothetical protein
MSVELNRTLDVATRLASEKKGSKEYFDALRAMIKHCEQSGHLVHSIDQESTLPVNPDHPLFPLLKEGKAHYEQLEIGGMTPEELIKALNACGTYISDWALSMMQNRAFTTLKEKRLIDVVRVDHIKDLGIISPEPFDKVVVAGSEHGLEKLPAEAGPHWRRAHMEDQPMRDILTFASDTITGRSGYPDVFYADRGGTERWLGGHRTDPDDRWSPNASFAFALASSEPQVA